jgi:hypothetical protein
MSRRRAPHRQPRGPRATLPPVPPRAPMPNLHDRWDWESACEDCQHWLDDCRCPTDGPS